MSGKYSLLFLVNELYFVFVVEGNGSILFRCVIFMV